MGQYWMLLNYDKRVTSSHIGKLAEFWSRGTGCHLFQRLLVPASPVPSRLGEEPDKSVINIGEWAGGRIICVGDYVGDCPLGVFTEDELKEVEAYNDLYQLGAYRFHSIRGERVLEEEMKVAYPEGRSWVLRNLSKQLFVNCGDVEQILLSYICWSTDPSSSMTHDVTRGSWAGDRFDIMVIEDVLEGSEGPWTDVTDEVTGKVKPIWESENARFTYRW